MIKSITTTNHLAASLAYVNRQKSPPKRFGIAIGETRDAREFTTVSEAFEAVRTQMIAWVGNPNRTEPSMSARIFVILENGVPHPAKCLFLIHNGERLISRSNGYRWTDFNLKQLQRLV